MEPRWRQNKYACVHLYKYACFFPFLKMARRISREQNVLYKHIFTLLELGGSS